MKKKFSKITVVLVIAFTVLSALLGLYRLSTGEVLNVSTVISGLFAF